LQWIFGKYTNPLILQLDTFIFQGTSTRRQQSELFGLRVKLPPVTNNKYIKFKLQHWCWNWN